jgi:heme-degrading monooxygenase HmoA
MFVMIVEVAPRPGRTGDYFEIAGRLRPLIEGAVGFVSTERFESLSEPGRFLSISIFRDEVAARACLESMTQSVVQHAGGEDMLALYRVRLASIVSDGGLKMEREKMRPRRRGFFNRLLPA